MDQKWGNERFKAGPLKQMSCNSGCFGSIEVTLLITNQEAFTYLHWITAQQSFDHSRLRLAAAADASVLCDAGVGMVWAKLKGVDMRANIGELVRHPFMQTSNMALLVKASGNS